MYTHTYSQAHTKLAVEEKKKQLTYTSRTEKKKPNTSVHDFPDFQIFPFGLWQFFPSFLFFPQPMSQQQSDDITGITTVLSSGTLTYESYQ